MAFRELLKLLHKDTYPGEARAMRHNCFLASTAFNRRLSNDLLCDALE
jgi:hypothetical protein